jgi:hypothetical protein
MRQIVQAAIAPADDAPADTSPSSSAPSTTAPAAPTTTSAAPAADVGDACAYDQARAAKALAEGEPQTRR